MVVAKETLEEERRRLELETKILGENLKDPRKDNKKSKTEKKTKNDKKIRGYGMARGGKACKMM